MKITDHGSQITAKQHGHSPFKDFGLRTLDWKDMKITDHGSQITVKEQGQSPSNDSGLWTLDSRLT